MSVVVDLGCQKQRIDRSIEPLVERFAPQRLLGFDPAARSPLRYDLDQTEVVVRRSAAWTHDGTKMFSPRGIDGTVMVGSSAWKGNPREVRCFDFSAWLGDLDEPEVIVKMDIEGAELPVLEKVVADGTDERISLLIVEWHDGLFDRRYSRARSRVEIALRCPVEIWP